VAEGSCGVGPKGLLDLLCGQGAYGHIRSCFDRIEVDTMDHTC